jgi:hypothetical protein
MKLAGQADAPIQVTLVVRLLFELDMLVQGTLLVAGEIQRQLAYSSVSISRRA